MSSRSASEPVPIELDLYLQAYDGPAWELGALRHREGWLIVAEAHAMTHFGDRSETLVAAVTDCNETLSAFSTECLFRLPASMPRDPTMEPPPKLEEAFDRRYLEFLADVEDECEERIADAYRGVDTEIVAQEWEAEQEVERVLADIAALRAERRAFATSAMRRAEIDAALKHLPDAIEIIALLTKNRIGELRGSLDHLDDAQAEGLVDADGWDTLAVIRWRAVSRRRLTTDWRLPHSRPPDLTRHPWHDVLGGVSLERVALMRPFKHERGDE